MMRCKCLRGENSRTTVRARKYRSSGGMASGVVVIGQGGRWPALGASSTGRRGVADDERHDEGKRRWARMTGKEDGGERRKKGMIGNDREEEDRV